MVVRSEKFKLEADSRLEQAELHISSNAGSLPADQSRQYPLHGMNTTDTIHYR